MMAKLVVKIEHVGLVNILAGESMVDEFIQVESRAGDRIGRAASEFLESPAKREALRSPPRGNLRKTRRTRSPRARRAGRGGVAG